MTSYYLAYLFYFAVVGLSIGSRFFPALFLFASTPLIGLVFLRGNVGVDSAMYEQSIDNIREAGTYTGSFEPLFEYASLVLGRLVGDSFLVLAVFAAFTTLLLFWGMLKLERRPYLLAFCVVPYFYLDMTMNGIRYGMAFALIICGAYFLSRGRRASFLGFAAAAALIQISSAALAALLIALLGMRWKTVTVALLAAVLGYIVFGPYLQAKLEANVILSAESAFSGIAPLLLSLATLSVLAVDGTFRTEARVQLTCLAALSFFTYLVSQVFYAGLRFQLLNLFLVFLFAACFAHVRDIKLSKKVVVMIFLIGLFSAGFRLKNFYTEAGQGDTPFAPYQFFWEQ